MHRLTRRRLFTLALSCAIGLIGTAAWAQSPLVAELAVVATRYHEDPARLDTLRARLEQAAQTAPDIKRGRIAETQRELQAVLDETAPTNPADWTFKDVGEARAILGSIRGRS